MLTARETMSPIVTSETIDCTPIRLFTLGVSGMVSVGLNAAAFVSETDDVTADVLAGHPRGVAGADQGADRGAGDSNRL